MQLDNAAVEKNGLTKVKVMTRSIIIQDHPSFILNNQFQVPLLSKKYIINTLDGTCKPIQLTWPNITCVMTPG